MTTDERAHSRLTAREKKRIFLRIITGAMVLLLLAAAALFSAGNFYSGRLVRSCLTEFASRETDSSSTCPNSQEIRLTGRDEYTWSNIKPRVINRGTYVLVILNDNSSGSGKLKSGVIHFTRDKEKVSPFSFEKRFQRDEIPDGIQLRGTEGNEKTNGNHR